LTYMRLYIG